MELATEIPSEQAPSSTTGSPNSIIDRKRELKAIPGSFSYNLGRRGSGRPLRLDTSLGHSPSRSVRSIVAWIESSAASKRSSSRLSASDDGTTTLRSNASSSYKLHGSLEASPSRQLDPGSTVDTRGVDGDCPTFLDYQKYFAQGSLARCLDEKSTMAVSPHKDVDAETAMHHTGQLQNKRDGIPVGEESVVVGKRSPAEVAAL